jgi:hypothetical protein
LGFSNKSSIFSNIYGELYSISFLETQNSQEKLSAELTESLAKRPFKLKQGFIDF